jgi:hypothetical protein
VPESRRGCRCGECSEITYGKAGPGPKLQGVSLWRVQRDYLWKGRAGPKAAGGVAVAGVVLTCRVGNPRPGLHCQAFKSTASARAQQKRLDLEIYCKSSLQSIICAGVF